MRTADLIGARVRTVPPNPVVYGWVYSIEQEFHIDRPITGVVNVALDGGIPFTIVSFNLDMLEFLGLDWSDPKQLEST